MAVVVAAVVVVVEGLNPGLNIPPPQSVCPMWSPLVPPYDTHSSLLGYASQNVLDCVGECRKAYNHKQVG